MSADGYFYCEVCHETHGPDVATCPKNRLRTIMRQQGMEGRKDDSSKAFRMELLAPEMLFGISAVLKFGADKYEPRNWEKGMAWGRVFGALMRHLWAWWGGKTETRYNFLLGELDDETKFSHLWHAGCCLMFLIAYEQRDTGEDDRFTS